MSERNNTIIKENEIRNHFDEQSGEIYYSIVDIIDDLGLSTDPRNYWKVLKNRLNKRDFKLVTECNQLKMEASDGKYYMTDVAKTSTLLQIIQIISPEKVSQFEEFFNHMGRENLGSGVNFFGKDLEEKNLSTEESSDGEIKVDMYQKDGCLFVTGMCAGIEKENIFISLNCKILTLKFSRLRQNIDEENYDIQELAWGKFGRVISLPFEVDIDRVETEFNYGLLSIQLFILDKSRTKIVKVL